MFLAVVQVPARRSIPSHTRARVCLHQHCLTEHRGQPRRWGAHPLRPLSCSTIPVQPGAARAAPCPSTAQAAGRARRGAGAPQGGSRERRGCSFARQGHRRAGGSAQLGCGHAAAPRTRRQPRSAAGRGSTSVRGREAAQGRAGQGALLSPCCLQAGRAAWTRPSHSAVLPWRPPGLGAKRRPPSPFELQRHTAFLGARACARLPALCDGFVPVCPGTGRV